MQMVERIRWDTVSYPPFVEIIAFLACLLIYISEILKRDHRVIIPLERPCLHNRIGRN